MRKNISSLLIIFIFIFIETILAQNFCDPGLCRRGQRHIACGNSGRFAAGCSGITINVQPHIGLILQLHNERRNTIAGGSLPRFPSALQMGTMSWDPTLARVAAFNVLQCRMEHDQCRNTPAFRFSGQNLSILFTRNVNIATFLRQRIESWFNEHRSANVNDIRNFQQRGGPAIGHFTVMVNERNTRVGCAISQFTSASRVQATLLACNYAVTNMINNPVYRAGRTASQCSTGRNPTFRNLCSVNEPFNHNQWSG